VCIGNLARLPPRGLFGSELRAWAQPRIFFTPDEMSILGVAAAIPNKQPTEKQSWRLIDLKEKAEAEGFIGRFRRTQASQNLHYVQELEGDRREPLQGAPVRSYKLVNAISS